MFKEDPIHQREFTVGNLHASRAVDSGIQWKLHALDQMKGDCIFHAASTRQREPKQVCNNEPTSIESEYSQDPEPCSHPRGLLLRPCLFPCCQISSGCVCCEGGMSSGWQGSESLPTDRQLYAITVKRYRLPAPRDKIYKARPRGCTSDTGLLTSFSDTAMRCD